MTLGLLGFWALVAVLAPALLRRPGQPDQQPQPGAEEIMALRLARGEIDAEEYRQLLLDRGAQHRLVGQPGHQGQGHVDAGRHPGRGDELAVLHPPLGR
jgi:hypothetical protein